MTEECDYCKIQMTETKHGNALIFECKECGLLFTKPILEIETKKNKSDSPIQQNLFGEELNIKKITKLTEQSIIPPFTVFDAKAGYWNARKREWRNIIPEDYEGRKENLLGFSKLVGQINKGTSVFDPVVCEVIYKWFCPNNGTILDPFAGGMSRGVVAGNLGFQYFGIDLSEKQIDTNYNKTSDLKLKTPPIWLVGNSLNMNEIIKLKDLKFDLIFSCPPYYDLEQYTKNPEDLSNYTTYDNFLDDYNKIIKNSCDKLKNDRFASFVVCNIRNKEGFYHDFVGDTIKAFEKNKVNFYNDIILLNPIGTSPMRAPPIFRSSKKVVRVHQNILIFYKGNPDNIKNQNI